MFLFTFHHLGLSGDFIIGKTKCKEKLGYGFQFLAGKYHKIQTLFKEHLKSVFVTQAIYSKLCSLNLCSSIWFSSLRSFYCAFQTIDFILHELYFFLIKSRNFSEFSLISLFQVIQCFLIHAYHFIYIGNFYAIIIHFYCFCLSFQFVSPE